jgi:hypothetical protein
MKALQVNETLEVFAPAPAKSLPDTRAEFALLQAASPSGLSGGLPSTPAHEFPQRMEPGVRVTARWFQPVSFPVKISQHSRAAISQRVREILC